MAQKRANLKICFVLDDGLDKPDGVQQYILTIGEYLRSQGHDVHYLVGETKRTDIENVHSLSRNIRVISNGNRMSMPLPTSGKKIRTLLEAEGFDVLHIQTPYSPFMGHKVIMNAPKSTAIISTFHIAPNTGLIHFGTKALGTVLRRSLKKVDYMISVSTAAQKFSADTFGYTSEVVPNPVDYARFNSAKSLKDYSDKKINILYLGRLVPRKGALVLLSALVELKKHKDLPDYRVIMCGKGPLMANVESYIAENSLQDKVELVGFVSEEMKPRYYASSDISVFPSTGGESFGIVLTEAMASGKAVVLGGDNVGYRSVLGPKPGLLFDTKNPTELSKLLSLYLKDSAKRKKMAYWGKEYSKQFDTKVVASRLIEIYTEALRKK
jgi:phosphatidylinositol alpha-mannosyltransferase